MKTIRNLPTASLCTIIMALGTANTAKAAQFFGYQHPLGEGFVRSFVTLDNQGNASEVGLILTKEALPLSTGNNSSAGLPIVISLPPEASATAVNYFELTYHPMGSPGIPEALDVPRFTIDSFLVSPKERALICPHPDTSGPVPACTGDELAQANKPPKAEFLPNGMQPTGVVLPSIGSRYFDPDALVPILTGQQTFTTLYDYAFFDGKPSLIGFGATKAFLETESNVTKPIKLPTYYPKSGYYPTEYSVGFDAASQEYKLALSGLKFRTATSVPEPSSTVGIFAIGAWGISFLFKRKLKQMAESND